MEYDLIVVGGGAAGFFTAIQYSERLPGRKVLILESSRNLLSKVAISGGGRCNVTHACFDPKEMVGYYPRGSKELLGPFHRFLCGDMMAWLDDHGVPVKIEEDGRVFPESDRSQSIIDCFMEQCRRNGVQIETSCRVDRLSHEKGVWSISSGDQVFVARQVMWATGSSPAAWKILARTGHAVIDPVPSLFTFNIRQRALHKLAGISVPAAEVSIPELNAAQRGPLLVTHWGISGPGVLKLSAWQARELHRMEYRFEIRVNWLGWSDEGVRDWCAENRRSEGGKIVGSTAPPDLPRRLWAYLSERAGVAEVRWADLGKAQIEALESVLLKTGYRVEGKSTFKEEFVTCGGIDTREIDFRTMESRLQPGLYFAGEVLNIDGVTGGFNFQAAWTESFIAAQAMD